jgi:hypothetical protein
LRVESVRRESCRTLASAYIDPYEITRIEGKHLVIIPNFEVGSKLIVREESVRADNVEI